MPLTPESIGNRSAGLLEGQAFDVDDELYSRWLTYVFDRSPGSSRPEFAATPQQLIALIGRTMTRAGTDLAGFDAAQIYSGLCYMFYNQPHSDCARHFGSSAIAREERIAAIRAMKCLYRDCFEARCDSVLKHLDEGTSNKLNSVAYMLWDETPIFYINREDAGIAAAIVEVLDFALSLNNAACIESALHGLGHAALALYGLEHAELDCPQLIHPVVDRFLETTRDAGEISSATGLRPIRNELRSYARLAREGLVL